MGFFQRIEKSLKRRFRFFTSAYSLKLPLGQVLVREEVITESQLQKALEIQGYRLQHLGRIIVDEGFATEIEILKAIAGHYRITATALSDNFEELINKKPMTLWEKLSYIRVPIRVKLSIAITFITWLTILILSFVILSRQKDHLYEQTLKTGQVTLNFLSNSAGIPLMKDNILQLNTLLKETDSVEGLVYAFIVDRKGVIKAHTNPDMIEKPLPVIENAEDFTQKGNFSYFNYVLSPDSRILNVSKKVTFKNVVLGEVNVGISLDFIRHQIYREGIFIVILSLFIVALGIAIAILISIGFSRPISELVLATHHIGKGDFHYRIDIARKDEFGDLAIAFNYMTLELWKKLRIQQSFGRYVSQEILDMILKNPEESWLKGNRKEVSILFTDVRGFTAYAEHREPEEVVEQLNTYFSIASQTILEYGGYVDKFIGDAVLGVFCVPVTCNDHAEKAVRAAVEMQKRLQEKGGEGIFSKIGIGINSGMVVAGNLGSQVKMEYTVIGDTVNVASRLNSLAGGGEIIISKSIYDTVCDIITAKHLPPQQVKGKAGLIEAFQVLDIKKM
jgi:adenylate cyclase